MFQQMRWACLLSFRVINPFVISLLCSVFFLAGCAKKNETLKFASWGSQSEIAIIKPILEDFQLQNPDIKVEFMHIPQDYFQKSHILFASNLAPDVLFINNLNLPTYANAGVLLDLTPYFETSVFFDKAIEALKFEDKLYAIPRDVSNLVVYYNKDIFDEMNVAYPKSNWTLEVFLRKAKKLTNNKHFGISFEETSMFYLPYLMSEGGGILSDDLSTEIIDTPQSQRGLSFYNDLRNKYNIAPKKNQSASATMAQMFLQEKLAMYLSGRWVVPKFRQDAKFNWDVINFPAGSSGSIVPMDASGWAIAKQTKQKEAAVKLIKFLSSKENIEKITASGLIVPARIDVSKSELFLDKNNSPQNSKVFINVIETSKKTPISLNYKQIQDKLDKKLNYLFNAL